MQTRQLLPFSAILFAFVFTGLVLFVPALAQATPAATGGLGSITSAVTGASDSAESIKTGVITILGVLATIGIAWAIVSGLRK
jgi:hypothetical protein